MRLKDFPDALEELKKLAISDDIDVDNTEVKNTAFYHIIHRISELDVSNLKCYEQPELLLLIAKIASTSHSLHTINMSKNDFSFENYGIKILKALTNCPNLVNLNIENIGLGAQGPEAATIIAKYNSLEKLNISNNHFYDRTSNVAVEILKSKTLKNVIFNENDSKGAKFYNEQIKEIFEKHKNEIEVNKELNKPFKEAVFLFFTNVFDDNFNNSDYYLPKEIIIEEILSKTDHPNGLLGYIEHPIELLQ